MNIAKIIAAPSILAMTLSLAAAASAQTAPPAAEDDQDAIRSSREIVVLGSIGFHNRAEEPQPVLVYDEEYFQRFEPLTAGDALKRVPSVTFLSDVIESDGARLRGMPDTGVFGNLGLIDSSIRDAFGKRRFNGQSKYVYNFGFIQDLRKLDAAFGATYRKQGRAYDRFVAEEVTTTYGADLEVFIEKRLGKSFTIRAVGSNLLNAKKREAFNKFNTIEDQIDRDFDEYELEAEEAGPVFQVIARYAF
jgi:outer membrane receptor protein involved in Fe transport